MAGESPGAFYPSLFCRGDKTHLVYLQSTGGTAPVWGLQYTFRRNENFSPPVTIGARADRSTLDGRVPRIIGGPGNSLYAIFSAYRTRYGAGCADPSSGGCSDVAFVESADDGATWSPASHLPHDPDFVQRFEPDLAVDGAGNLYEVHDRGGTIVFRMRPAGLLSWTAEAPIATGMEQHGPHIAVTGPSGGPARFVHVIFRGRTPGTSDDSLYYVRFDGVAWSAPVVLSRGGDLGPGTALATIMSALVSDGASTLDVALQARRTTYQIFHLRSTDQGSSWSLPTTAVSQTGYRPTLSRDPAGVIDLFWEDNLNVFHTRLAQGTWSVSRLVSSGLHKSLEAAAAVDPRPPSTVYVAFHALTSSTDTFYKIHINAEVSGSVLADGGIAVGDAGTPVEPPLPWDAGLSPPSDDLPDGGARSGAVTSLGGCGCAAGAPGWSGGGACLVALAMRLRRRRCT